MTDTPDMPVTGTPDDEGAVWVVTIQLCGGPATGGRRWTEDVLPARRVLAADLIPHPDGIWAPLLWGGIVRARLATPAEAARAYVRGIYPRPS